MICDARYRGISVEGSECDGPRCSTITRVFMEADRRPSSWSGRDKGALAESKAMSMSDSFSVDSRRDRGVTEIAVGSSREVLAELVLCACSRSVARDAITNLDLA